MMIPIAKIDTMTIGYIPQLPSLKCFHRPAICSPPRGVCRRVISETWRHVRPAMREKAREARKIASGRHANRALAGSKAPMYPALSERRARGARVRLRERAKYETKLGARRAG